MSSLSVYPDSNFLYYTRCPHCALKGRDRSGDNLAVYDHGWGHCYSCDANVKKAVHNSEEFIINERGQNVNDWVVGKAKGVPARGISVGICARYGYEVSKVNNKDCYVANFYDNNRKLIGQKYRFDNKKFKIKGDCSGLFGKHLWTKGKKIVITEGEIDCLSVAEVQEGKWPTVSIPNGAAGAEKCIVKELEWLQNNFEEVVLMFDMDEPGSEAAKKVASLFKQGKCKIAKLPMKDANECLMNGESNAIRAAIWNAEEYRQDGILNAKDVADDICSAYRPADAFYPWGGLNEITRGLRKGEIVTFCAGTGIGKSQIMREVAYSVIKANSQTKIGYIALEESLKRTAFGLMSIEANKPLHLNPDLTEEELRDYHNKVFGGGNVYLYDHWGSMDYEVLLSKIRYLAHACGVDWVVLDHVSIVVSGEEGGDERRLIDNLMTALRKLVEELNVGLLLVSHLKRPEGKTHEEGGHVTLGQLRGSAAIGQLSDIVIGLERNQQDEERKNVSTVRVLKNRFSGDTGIAAELRYSHETGRMLEEDELMLESNLVDEVF